VVNDGRPARFLVDTGAFACMISPRLAEALGMPWSRCPGGPDDRHRWPHAGPMVTLQSVGSACRATDVVAVVHDMGSGDRILGSTFLSRFTVTLDRRGLLTLRRSDG
jgi:predicted aspartyl protease